MQGLGVGARVVLSQAMVDHMRKDGVNDVTTSTEVTIVGLYGDPFSPMYGIELTGCEHPYYEECGDVRLPWVVTHKHVSLSESAIAWAKWFSLDDLPVGIRVY